MVTTIVPPSYMPNAASRDMLNKAMAIIQSVPYQTTARWLFYRLLQAGFYHDKKAYKGRFLQLITRARKGFYGGWAPNTLADDNRESLIRGIGHTTAIDWLTDEVSGLACTLDKWECQSHYVEVWFEAAAMSSQFEYYTRHVTLRPFRGDPSLDFKWTIAKDLEKVARWYPGKPITVLYFGDLDPKGLQIPESAADDIRAWSSVPFTFQRCGLNPGHETQYNIPENLDKPGCYQWEGLADDAARGLILDSLGQYVDVGAQGTIMEEERRIQDRFRAEVDAIVSRWGV